MISVLIEKRNGQYRRITAKGHAMFDDYGKDIVCAAVSVLLINTLNAVERFTDDTFHVDQNPDEGFLKAEFEQQPLSHDAELLLSSLCLGLSGIAEEYRENLKLTIKEV